MGKKNEGKKIKKMVKIVFPQKLIRKPLTFLMAKKYDVTPSIRRCATPTSWIRSRW